MTNMSNGRKKSCSPSAILFGEAGITSAPSLSARELLVEMGWSAELGTIPGSALECLHLARRFDYAIYIDYGMPSAWLVRQFAIMALLGVRIIRWWVGSDVLYLLDDVPTSRRSQQLDRHVSANFCVSSHLTHELRKANIESVQIPIVPSSLPPLDKYWDSGLARSVLVYLPKNREEFYGAKVLDRLVADNPATEFILVSNDGARYRGHPNVVGLGWVDDMEQVYSRAGSLLRLTSHDGLPRMVIEALARGKYVVYSWPFDGCSLAKTYEEAGSALKYIARATEVNSEGAAIARRDYCLDTVKLSIEKTLSEMRSGQLRLIFRSLLVSASIPLNRLKLWIRGRSSDQKYVQGCRGGSDAFLQ